MKRREFLGTAIGTAASLWATPQWAAAQGGADSSKPPNILWLTCEDMSPHLGCYGYDDARTPNLDYFATESARYTNAYSVSGVCAPSRSCLITGMYPSSLGSHHMRSSIDLPEHVRAFPAYLRNAGYYCTNNRKTDYNFSVPKDAWDESSNKAHWKNRPDANQPFFAVFNHTGTHEWPTGHLPDDGPAADPPHDPAAVTLPPYFPDTPVVRRHWAHYLDLVTRMDVWVGEHLKALDEAGLAENTIVFFYSDHGTGLPRMKRWLYDAGLHVPLMIRWPGQIEPGTVTDRLVSFVDFAPTVLSLAGLAVPDHLQGTPFLAADDAPREYIYAARDRMDERYDIIRAVRDKRYKYIRNYEPHRPYDQYLTYPESMPVMQEMRRVEAEGNLTDAQALFFRDEKPLEELYDTAADPHELNNLANDPNHRAALHRLRAELDAWMASINDLGLVPEIELHAWRPAARAAGDLRLQEAPPAYELPDALADRAIFGATASDHLEHFNSRDRLARLRAVRSLGLLGKEAATLLTNALDDPEPAVAYWAALSMAEAHVHSDALSDAMARPEPSARLAAARALFRLGNEDAALPVLIEATTDANPFVRIFAVETLEPAADRLPAARDALNHAYETDDDGYVHRIAAHALGEPVQ